MGWGDNLCLFVKRSWFLAQINTHMFLTYMNVQWKNSVRRGIHLSMRDIRRPGPPATKCQLSPQIIIKSRNGPINFQRSTGGQYSFCQEPSPPLSVARTLTLPLGGPVTPEEAKRTEKHTAESQSKVKVSSLASGRKRRGARQQ